jgi:hypothetical protein
VVTLAANAFRALAPAFIEKLSEYVKVMVVCGASAGKLMLSLGKFTAIPDNHVWTLVNDGSMATMDACNASRAHKLMSTKGKCLRAGHLELPSGVTVILLFIPHTCFDSTYLIPQHTATKMSRIVTLGRGDRKWNGLIPERLTNPKLVRATCSPRYGLQPCGGKSAGVASGRVSDLLPESLLSRFATFASL